MRPSEAQSVRHTSILLRTLLQVSRLLSKRWICQSTALLSDQTNSKSKPLNIQESSTPQEKTRLLSSSLAISSTSGTLLKIRNNQLQRVAETHRSYDVLQHPLLFCHGEDGYKFQLLRVDSRSEQATTKTASNQKLPVMDSYAYRIMLRNTISITS